MIFTDMGPYCGMNCTISLKNYNTNVVGLQNYELLSS